MRIRSYIGNKLFKLAAWVAPNKPKKPTKVHKKRKK